MSPIEQLIVNFQELVAHVPEIVRPFIVMLAGAVPFIEGEGGAIIGVAGGLHPVLAWLAAAAGNFLSVLVVVMVTSRTRRAVVDRRATLVGARAGATGEAPIDPFDAQESAASAEPESKGRQRFKRWLVRFGVPGTSVANPIDIPVWGLKEGERYILEDVINLLKDDGNLDSIIVYVEMGSIMDFAESDAEGLQQLEDICDSVLRSRPGGAKVTLALRSAGDKLQDDFVREQRVRLLPEGIAVFGTTTRAVLAQDKLFRMTRRPA